MEWVLHIGHQKTGSKALQNCLARHPERIRGLRVSFPVAGREVLWHRPIHDELVAGSVSALRQAREEAEASGCELAVLSFEGFCTMPRPAIQLLREELGPARVVLFMRRQDELANSMLNQIVMGHRTTLDWIEEFESLIACHDPMLDYRCILSGWVDAYGKEAVKPLKYDKSQDIVVQFGHSLGLEVTPGPLDGGNPNPALDAESYRAIRELKRGVALEDLPGVVQRAHEAMSHRFIDTYRGPGLSLVDDETRAAIMANYVESNEWVRAGWFPESSSLF